MLLSNVRCKRSSSCVCYEGVQKNSNDVLAGVESVCLGGTSFLSWPNPASVCAWGAEVFFHGQIQQACVLGGQKFSFMAKSSKRVCLGGRSFL